jgi:hypothetical protein
VGRLYFISPIGQKTPMLFDTFEKTFAEQGHCIVGNINDADVVFFDGHSGLYPYNDSEIDTVIYKNLPVVFFDQFDYFSGNGYKNTWKERYLSAVVNAEHWAKAVYRFKDHLLFKVHFMRKMSKTIQYLPNVYPLELIQYPDHDFKPVSKEELFSRPFDFCFIGNKAAPRNNLCSWLARYFRCDFVLGEPRIEHNEWLNRHRQAKFFIECGGGGESGGGFRSERTYQLITIAARLACYDEQIVKNDFVDMEDTVIAGDSLGNVNQYDVNKISQVLNDKERLYEIYLKGIERIHKYFNAEYRAKYILEILEENNII